MQHRERESRNIGCRIAFTSTTAADFGSFKRDVFQQQSKREENSAGGCFKTGVYGAMGQDGSIPMTRLDALGKAMNCGGTQLALRRKGRCMRYCSGFMLACVLFFSCAGWCQSNTDRASVRRIVLRYCQLDAEAALINPGKSVEVRKYISDDVVLRQFPMMVIKGFSVEHLEVANDTATVVIDYDLFGQLNDNLAYKPILDLREKAPGQPATGNLQVEFKLTRTKTGWVISACGSGVHVTIDQAIAFLKKEQNSSPSPMNKLNAGESLSLLQASPKR